VSEDVFRQAAELECDFFAWLSRGSRDDIQAGADGLGLAQERLVAFMRDHRSELEADPHWQTYFNDLDRIERPVDADVAEQRRADRDRWAQDSSAAAAPVAPPNAGRQRGGRRDG
jgi:hypothetical protein